MLYYKIYIYKSILRKNIKSKLVKEKQHENTIEYLLQLQTLRNRHGGCKQYGDIDGDTLGQTESVESLNNELQKWVQQIYIK